MNFSENLYKLRKRDKITQEALADKLGVSRQSVSKWETGEAYPETDKLIALSDLFGVSLDELVRGNVEAEKTESEDIKDDCGFVKHMNMFSVRIALGVFLIFMGVAVCAAFSGYAQTTDGIFEIIGAVVLLLFIAAAIFLFVFSGISHRKFEEEHPEIGNVIPKNKIAEFNKRFPIAMACLVSGILVDVVFLIVLTTLLDRGTIFSPYPDTAMCYVVSVFLFLLGGIICGLTFFGIQHSKYIISEYNKQARDELNPAPKTKLKRVISSVVMLSATAVFLLLGFVWNFWHPAWVVFPVGGIICGIVNTILDSRGK